MSEFYDKLEELKDTIPEKYQALIRQSFDNYCLAAKGDRTAKEENCCTYLELVVQQIKNPYFFEPFHKKITSPFDYHKFAMDFMKPLIVMEESTVKGDKNLAKIEELTAAGENVILLANHQTEPDPQIIFCLLKDKHPKLVDNIIFIAGDRVVTDPMSVPFSLGCNLICIFSKKHIENPPERKLDKLKHNQRTMKIFSELLSRGGQCIYVAPSGGRDRPDDKGIVDVAPFDPQSIEMLRLMSNQAGSRTHFFPLALDTYDILPPPSSVEVELGEVRTAKRSAAHLYFGPEIDMDTFAGSEESDKRVKRQKRADYIWSIVRELYHSL